MNYNNRRAEELMERLTADPSYSRSGNVASDLLTEFHRGYPLENLRPLLHDGDIELTKIATWIASELGEKGNTLLDDVSPLLQHEDSRVRFFVINCILLWADPSKGRELASVVNLI